MRHVTKLGQQWQTVWELRETGEPERPWAIYGNGVLCWYTERFTTGVNYIRKHNPNRWDDVLKRWKPSFLADGVDFEKAS